MPGRSISLRSIACAAAIAVTLSCSFNDGDVDLHTGEFTRTPEALWAGDTLWVTSQDFSLAEPDAFSLTLNDQSFALEYRDQRTRFLVVPDTVSGTFSLALRAEEGVISLPGITVFGFSEVRQYPVLVNSDLYIYPRGGLARVMGGRQAGNSVGLSFVNLEHGTAVTYPILNTNYLRGPGATPDPNVFIVRTTSTRTSTYRFGAEPVLVDSQISCSSERQAMLMSPGVCFRSTHHWYDVTGYPQDVTAEETEGVHLSPKGDRATFQVDGMPEELPVFDAATGGVAYRLPIHESNGVFFSEDGEFLAVVGKTINNETPSRVLLVQSTSGAILADTTIAQHAANIAIDPVRPFVYVGAVDSLNRAQLVVLRKDNLGFVARLSAPASVPHCEIGCYKAVVVVGTQNDVYFASGTNFNELHAYRFIVPRPQAAP